MPRLASRNRGIFFARTAWLWLGVLAAAVVVYLPGLHGPFLFDDVPNLKPLLDWLAGSTGWQEALLGNRSGLLGRPLSMLTFVADAHLFGVSPYWFKLTNLLIHLACGTVVIGLLRRLLARDARLNAHATGVAFLIGAVWLLHPMQVSTVLYIVQRMAQLSALFILLALLAYVYGRTALELGRLRSGIACLFIGVPGASIAAVLCKENGALVPLLCAVLELGYFRSSAQMPRPRVVKAFFLFGLVLPLFAGAAWLSFHPDYFAKSYSGRTFTLSERLLSEPRVLFDYIGALLLPSGPKLGLYSDDFPVSESLLQPVSTLFALAGLIALAVLAWAARRQVPAVFTGIAFYLAGHAMESGVFPLELYFEHRNYLPSMGLFLAVAGAVDWSLGKLPRSEQTSQRPMIVTIGAVAVCVMLATATAARAWVWQSWTTLAEQGQRQHPNSTRAQFDYANVLWTEGKLDETQRFFDHLAANGNPVSQHLAVLYTVRLECRRYHSVKPESLARLRSMTGTKLQLAEMNSFEQLASDLRATDCAGLSKSDFANILATFADAAPQPQSQTPVWRTRFTAADLYRLDGRAREAESQAAMAWMTGAADPAVGVQLATLYASNGNAPSAKIILDDVRKHVKYWDRRNLKLIADLQEWIDVNMGQAPSSKE